ncbi:MAG: Mur ligase domain-containing protein [Saprospiraceae bacterium]|nr:Mur ligase domain-containing protein [Saprospiraceae bacterium]
MRIHVIAMGGVVMHNLSIALHLAGHQITGSDDEIYNPAKDRLSAHGLLPLPGWYPDKLSRELDLVIIGMHAKKDNPELLRAQELNLKLVSYPEFIAIHAEHKKRIVIAGSHGKTTTTSMIMHALKALQADYDYLVGAPLEGFEHMIRLSPAPVMIIEGDEYLSSPIDLVPKILHYHPQVTAITGIAWDHINVFPSEQGYQQVFKTYLDSLAPGTVVYYFNEDLALRDMIEGCQDSSLDFQPYTAYPHTSRNGTAYLIYDHQEYPIAIFGLHNLQNIQAAVNVCKALGYPEAAVLKALTGFKGAAKRLQPLFLSDRKKVYLDFAHAPSKVRATVSAIREQYTGLRLITILELHTFSSLNKSFIPQYNKSLDPADEAVVFYNKHTLEIKRMPDLDKNEIKNDFGCSDLFIFTQNKELEEYLDHLDTENSIVLFMSSGTFNGVNIKDWANRL